MNLYNIVSGNRIIHKSFSVVCALALGVTTSATTRVGVDLVAQARGPRGVRFADVLDARFASSHAERFSQFSAWANNIAPEERDQWKRLAGTKQAGTPGPELPMLCASVDSRGLPRAMIAAASQAPDRTTATRRWEEVEHTYIAAKYLEREMVAQAKRAGKTRPTGTGAELAVRVAKDQAWRNGQFSEPHDAAVREAIMWRFSSKMCHVDYENVRWLMSLVSRGIWPMISRDGAEAAGDAWLLAQHADDYPKFQQQILAILEPLVKRGEAGAKEYAMLFDRVAVAAGRPQRYGTQFTQDNGGCLAAINTEDAEHINQRRATMNMGTIEEYSKDLSKSYHIPICHELFAR